MPRDPERIDRIRQLLREASLDGLVCSLPENVLLISGYWPVVGVSLALINREGEIAIIAPEDERELADSAEADALVTFQPGSLDCIDSAAEAVRAPLLHTLRKLGLDRAAVGCESGVAHEPAPYVSMHPYGTTISALLPSPQPADELLARLKSIKTDIEIDRIRRACRIAHCAFLNGAASLRPGLKETEAAAAFRVPLSSAGIGFEGVERADGFVFCMSGPDAAHAYGAYARSRARFIEVADLVLTHCNSYADGYWTDITRTFIMENPEERHLRMYEAIFSAHEAALQTLRPGVKAAEVDRAARTVLADRGFGDAFKHPTGHGVGYAAIDHNAAPLLHPKSTEVLETGMVFNIQPGIYLETCGLRHCDVVALTRSGAEVLTPFQSTIQELTI